MTKKVLFEEVKKRESQCKELDNRRREIEKTISKLHSEISDYQKIIKEYSIFDKNLIGEALANLITTISGREFIYREIDNTFVGEIYSIFGYYYGQHSKVEWIVVDSSKYKKEYYSEKSNEVEKLKDAGDAIWFPWYAQGSLIQFYTYPHAEFNEREFKFNAEIFDYIEPFIQALIQYCYERGIKYSYEENTFVTKEDINECLKEFLENYKIEHTTKNPTKTIGKKIKKGE